MKLSHVLLNYTIRKMTDEEHKRYMEDQKETWLSGFRIGLFVGIIVGLLLATIKISI